MSMRRLLVGTAGLVAAGIPRLAYAAGPPVAAGCPTAAG
jgi:hypothetical protein